MKMTDQSLTANPAGSPSVSNVHDDEGPVSLAPLDPAEALKAMLNTAPASKGDQPS